MPRRVRQWREWRWDLNVTEDLLSGSFRFLGGHLKTTVSDETLFLELALRGYDLSKLRDAETTAEILKLASLDGKSR